MTKVVNAHNSPYDIYIDRKNNSIYHWGNSFSVGPDGDREDVIQKFRFGSQE